MTTLSIVITTANQAQMDANVNAFAAATGYKAVIGQDANSDDIANPLSAELHARNQVRKFISDKVRDYVVSSQVDAARVSAAQIIAAATAGVTIELE